MSSFKYIVCPRGNGIDTHRLWEALYLRIIPIVVPSGMDQLYTSLPVLRVSSFTDVTAELLESKYAEFQEMFDRPGALDMLTRDYWFHKIEEERAEALEKMGISDVSERRRCWGKNS